MRFSLKALLVLPVVAAITFWVVLPAVYSENYYVISNLHLEGWELRKMTDVQINQRIPFLPPPEDREKPAGNDHYTEYKAYAMSHWIEGVKISAQVDCVAFEMQSTRWYHAKAVTKVHEQMRAFLRRNPDLKPSRAAVEIVAYDRLGPGNLRKRQISYTRFDSYPVARLIRE